MTTTTVQTPPRWLAAAVAGAFGLFYAYAVWAGVGLVIAPSPDRTAVGWAVVIFAAAFPIIVFAAACAVGVRRRLGAFALILAAGLSLVAVFLLNVLSYALVSGVV